VKLNVSSLSSRSCSGAQFGRRSERLDADQLALALEDLDGDTARIRESRPAIATDALEARSPRKPLPDHLPREDVVLTIAGDICGCCGGALHAIGKSVSEMLDWVPAQLRVVRITRPKYACRSCNKVVQAPAPERLIAGGLATPALLAQVMVSKYCDHTPLYRQSQIFARHGVDLGRSTLVGWVGGACWWLEALHERMCKNVFASDHLFADDTPIPVLDPGRGRTKTGRLWVYARDAATLEWTRTTGGGLSVRAGPQGRATGCASRTVQRRPARRWLRGVRAADRQWRYHSCRLLGAYKAQVLRGHRGNRLARGNRGLAQRGELYAIEARVRGQSSAHRLAERRSFSRPIVQALHT
jgi:transposase